MIHSYLDHFPRIDNSAFIAPSAEVIGSVCIGANSSIWHGSVLRGDINSISVGTCTNIQDLSVVHVTAENSGTVIGDNVTIGHRCIIHGCTIASNSLIGMGAIILDNAIIPEFTLVAAGSLVPPGKTYRSGYLIIGSPARELRQLTQKERDMIEKSANSYAILQKNYSR